MSKTICAVSTVWIKTLDVLDYLEESGLAENTIVIYTSDQGWYLGEHGWYDKRWMYEESFRTPLMVRPERLSRAPLILTWL